MENAITVTQQFINTLQIVLSNFFSSLDTNIYSILDDIIFINSDILNDSLINNLLGNSLSSSLLVLCNSLSLGFIIYYIISLILSHLFLFNVQAPHQFIFKLIIISIIINYTYDICIFIINLNSNISLAIRSIGEDLFNTQICFSSLEKLITPNFTDNFNLFSINGFLKSFSSMGTLNLILSYSLRYIMIKIFILIFPFALLSLLNKSTNYFFYSFIKSFISLLFSQVIVSFVLLIIFSLDFSNNNLFSQIILIGALYFLSRINYFLKELIGGVSTTIYSNAQNLKSLFRGGY